MRVLFLAAHPDDIEFFAGGIAKRHVAEGDHVIFSYYAHGEEANNHGIVRKPAKARQRFREAQDSAAHLGVQDVTFLGHAGKRIRPTEHAFHQTLRLLEWYDPETVYAPRVRSGWVSLHPDHRAVGTLVQYAAEHAPLRNSLRLYGGFNPTQLVDVSPYHTDVENALRKHQSQWQYLKWYMPFRRQHTKRLGRKLGVERAEGIDELKF